MAAEQIKTSNAVFCATLHDFTDRIQIFLLVLCIGVEPPTDVIYTVSNGDQRCAAPKDVLIQTRKALLGCFSAFASIYEFHIPLRKSQERVVLDDFAVFARSGYAIAEEHDGIAICNGKIGSGERRKDKEQ